MDETSIKAGRTAPGKMRQAYFWPVYGDQDEIVFHYAPTRQHRHVETFLNGFKGTLLSDGYAAYEVYAKRHGLSHAQCWRYVAASIMLRRIRIVAPGLRFLNFTAT